MTTPVIWIHYARPRSHWYTLNEAEQRTKKQRWAEISEQATSDGATFVGAYHIRGQHDFETVEIWNFPSGDRAFDYWKALTASGYNEWMAFSNNVGFPITSTPQSD